MAETGAIVTNIGRDQHWYVTETRPLEYLAIDGDDARLDTTGFTLRWELRNERGRVVVSIADGSITKGSSVPDSTLDLLQLTVLQAALAGLRAGQYRHALIRHDVPDEVMGAGNVELLEL